VGLLKKLLLAGDSTAAAKLARELAREEQWDAQSAVLIGQALAAVFAHGEVAQFLQHQRQRHSMEVSLHHNLGISLQALKRLPEALSAFRRAIEILPVSERSITSAGSVLRDLGRKDEALEFHAAAVRINPQNAHAWYNFGNTLLAVKEYAAAENAYRKSLEIEPEGVECLNNLSTALCSQAKFRDAIPVLIKLNTLRPNSPEYLVRLVNALREVDQPLRALGFAEIMLRQAPDKAMHHFLTASCLSILGRPAEAFACFQKAIDLEPDNLTFRSPKIYTANYLPFANPEDLFEIHREYGRLLESVWGCGIFSVAPARPKGRIRLGYVSGDFCKHPVTSFFLPVVENHDRSRFEIYCYSNFIKEDAVTARIQKSCDHFIQISRWSDEEVCARIREDEIDILIDLSGHTARNRLPVFARKPAPVQATMIGHMQTTGLRAMDYRITDPTMDPEGFSEHLHTEELVRMESGGICFRPPDPSPEVSPLPCLEGKPFTFGSFNNLAKINDQVLDAWARVLLSLPQARMRVVAMEAQFFLEKMEARHVSRERFEILPRTQEYEYLEAHQGMDLILDTFPFNGLTVTMNALWMGVPCVTLKGPTSASRGGFTLLDRVGLGAFAAADAEEYVRIAAYWAEHPQELAQIRAALRDRFRNAWTDATRYTRELEHHFEQMLGRLRAEALPHAATAGAEDTPSRTEPQGAAERPNTGAPAARGNPVEPTSPPARKSEAERLWALLESVRSDPDPVVALGRLVERIRSDSELADALRGLDTPPAGGERRWGTAVLVCEIWHALGDADRARAWKKRAGEGPKSGNDWLEVARAWERMGWEEDATEALQAACSTPEPPAQALLLLANRVCDRDPATADTLYRRAISYSPRLWQAYLNLSILLQKSGALDAALTLADYAVKLTADPLPLLHLAVCQNLTGRFSEALETAVRVPQTPENSGAVFTSIGKSFWGLGMPVEAARAFSKALEMHPDDKASHDNLLHLLNHIPDFSAETFFEKHRCYSVRFEEPLRRTMRFGNARDPHKRLRVGYVSPDLRTHSVSYFVEPIVSAHDRTQFEVYGIFTGGWRDATTERIKKSCDHWIDAAHLPDEALAERLEREQIDILVDLSCHSAGNRLLMFARKPAPVQVTMIGMQQTTGLTSMDYRITDADMDPPGMTEAVHSESLLRLQRAFVFQPPDSSVEVAPLPALQAGYVTFGSFNNFAKTHPAVLETWAAVLQQAPNSRFCAVVPDGAVFEDYFIKAGIAPERVFRMQRQSGDAYLRMHHGVDIALDCFPFAGLTVSLFAAWMGVPTVTLGGRMPSARAGVSILRALDLEEWIASDPADFIQRAVSLASDRDNLARIRGSLRERMARQLTHREGFVQDYEAHLREAWRKWCAS
jgi:predicted O-linked N-acetylglucosamine transferase (SPINDLY family)